MTKQERLTIQIEPEGMKGMPLRFEWGWSCGSQKAESIAVDYTDLSGRWAPGGVLTHEQVLQLAQFFSVAAQRIEAQPKDNG